MYDKAMEILRIYLPKETAMRTASAICLGLDVIVDGPQGPTGKSTVCRKLREIGVNAKERWQIKESDNNSASVVITLNEMIKEMIKGF